MTEKKKEYVIRTDKDTHTTLAVWAAKRKTTIKQVLKELVDKAKKQEAENV